MLAQEALATVFERHKPWGKLEAGCWGLLAQGEAEFMRSPGWSAMEAQWQMVTRLLGEFVWAHGKPGLDRIEGFVESARQHEAGGPLDYVSGIKFGDPCPAHGKPTTLMAIHSSGLHMECEDCDISQSEVYDY